MNPQPPGDVDVVVRNHLKVLVPAVAHWLQAGNERAVVRGGLIAEWQLFADDGPLRQRMTRASA